MLRMVLIFLVSCLTFLQLSASSPAQSLESTSLFCNKKVLICGVCRDVEPTLSDAIANMEQLGRCCSDYGVIICEDNSKDKTVSLLSTWAQKNKRVTFTSDIYCDTHLSKEEKIARARNKVLKIARDPKYQDFEYLIMVDLDLRIWPIEEILRTLNDNGDWDCVSANGMKENGDYWDRYAFRDEIFPLGPELLGSDWWTDLYFSFFKIDPNDEEWRPVYSAFGGLGIYKKESIIPFSYSGKATVDLKEYYRKIIQSLPPYNLQLQKYLRKINATDHPNMMTIPIEFTTFRGYVRNTFDAYIDDFYCCEHVPLHASMALHGHGKFFINPKLILHY